MTEETGALPQPQPSVPQSASVAGVARVPVSRRLEQVDSLRGLAALSVVLWHWIYLSLPTDVPGGQPAVFERLLWQHDPRALAALGGTRLLTLSPLRILFAGHEAVVLFFVLSGFVLSLPLWEARQLDYLPFVIRRVFRIYLPYLGALTLAVAGNLFLSAGGLPEMNAWFNASWTTPVRVADVLEHATLIGVFHDNQFNPAFWSLIHEMRVSLVYPFVFFLLRRWPRARWLWPVPLMALGCFLHGRYPWGRLCESIEVLGFFVAGMALGRDRERIATLYRSWGSIHKALVVAACAGFYTYGWSWIVPAWAFHLSSKYQDLFVCLGATGILGLSLASPTFQGLLMKPVPRYLGRISYSLYLTHATVLWGLVYLLRQTSGLLWIYTVLALVVASLFWTLLEDPARQVGYTLSRRALQRPQKAGAGDRLLRFLQETPRAADS
ncbi:MAG TPA: acyltransferase [Myxococcota bacterium]|nr:acyltransferase [Myxococcota bacterium]